MLSSTISTHNTFISYKLLDTQANYLSQLIPTPFILTFHLSHSFNMFQGPLHLSNGTKKPDASPLNLFQIIILSMEGTPDVSSSKIVFHPRLFKPKHSKVYIIAEQTSDWHICRSIGTKLLQKLATIQHSRPEQDSGKSKESFRDKNPVNPSLRLPQSPSLRKPSQRRPSAVVPTTLHQRSERPLLLTAEEGLPMEWGVLLLSQRRFKRGWSEGRTVAYCYDLLHLKVMIWRRRSSTRRFFKSLNAFRYKLFSVCLNLNRYAVFQTSSDF